MTAQITRVSANAETKRFPGKPFTITVGAVCPACNEGWMSNLEGRAKPYLAGMIQGRGRELHLEAQQIIAAWSFLKIAMLERAWEIRMIPPEHFQQFYGRPQEPPDEVYVWVGAVNPEGGGRRLPGFFQGRGLTLGDPDEDLDAAEVPDGYVATFSVNHFVVKVYGHRLDERRELIHRSKVRNSIQRIWPVERRSFIWPPGPVLVGPDGLQALAAGPVA